MAAKLTDVAKLAGVSLATASRAFGDPGRLAAETRQKVMDAAAQLGYDVPGLTGSRTFGVVVPDISNAVFAALIKAIQDQAWHGRHRMVLADTAESSARERDHLEAFATGVDGIILCSPRLPSDQIHNLAGNAPLVVINGEADHAARVLMEAGEGIRQAVEHLHALGHRKLAYIPGPASSWANGQRLAAITRLCDEWGIELVTVGNQNATVDGGLAAAASVVASGATAVIAYNDLVAIGMLAGARTLGYHCPEDISVVGIDDLDIAAAAEPGLTSVRVPDQPQRLPRPRTPPRTDRRQADRHRGGPPQFTAHRARLHLRRTHRRPHPPGKVTMRIVIADPNLMPQRATFEAALPEGTVTSWHDSWNEHSVLTDLKDADVYVGPKFTAAMGAEARNLRLVHVAGAGYDGIDADALPAGAVCANTFHHEGSIAEHIAAVLVALRRNLLGQDAALRTGVWASSVYSPEIPQPETLRGAVVTFLGFGHIGSAAWKLLQAFGAEGIAITRSGIGQRAGKLACAGPAPRTASARPSANPTCSWSASRSTPEPPP